MKATDLMEKLEKAGVFEVIIEFDFDKNDFDGKFGEPSFYKLGRERVQVSEEESLAVGGLAEKIVKEKLPLGDGEHSGGITIYPGTWEVRISGVHHVFSNFDYEAEI